MNEKLTRFIAARARDHYEGERWKDAELASDLLITMAPDVADYWTLRGILKRKLNQPTEALEALKRAHTLSPDDRNTKVNLGEVLCINGRVEEGVRLLAEVFDAGYDPALSQEAQDAVTRRAGFNLAALRRLASARKIVVRNEATG